MPIIITGGAGDTGVDKFTQMFMQGRQMAARESAARKDEERYQTEVKHAQEQAQAASLYKQQSDAAAQAGLTPAQADQAQGAVDAFLKMGQEVGMLPGETVSTYQNMTPDSSAVFGNLSDKMKGEFLKREAGLQAEQRFMQQLQAGAERLQTYVDDGLVDEVMAQELMARLQQGDQQAYEDMGGLLQQGAQARVAAGKKASRERGMQSLLKIAGDGDPFEVQEILDAYSDGDRDLNDSRRAMALAGSGVPGAVAEDQRIREEHAAMLAQQNQPQFQNFAGASGEPEQSASPPLADMEGQLRDYGARLAASPGDMDTVIAELKGIYGDDQAGLREAMMFVAVERAKAQKAAEAEEKQTKSDARKAKPETGAVGSAIEGAVKGVGEAAKSVGEHVSQRVEDLGDLGNQVVDAWDAVGAEGKKGSKMLSSKRGWQQIWEGVKLFTGMSSFEDPGKPTLTKSVQTAKDKRDAKKREKWEALPMEIRETIVMLHKWAKEEGVSKTALNKMVAELKDSKGPIVRENLAERMRKLEGKK